MRYAGRVQALEAKLNELNPSREAATPPAGTPTSLMARVENLEFAMATVLDAQVCSLPRLHCWTWMWLQSCCQVACGKPRRPVACLVLRHHGLSCATASFILHVCRSSGSAALQMPMAAMWKTGRQLGRAAAAASCDTTPMSWPECLLRLHARVGIMLLAV
jgi:hypothetical protein